MYKEIGAFDAKARFSELLRGVSEGQRYMMSVRGKPVADLIPSQANPLADARLAMDALRKLPMALAWIFERTSLDSAGGHTTE
ncbi:type II toxin-antitoxin system Phd/YefM family antitoxin [Pseudoduganella sp. S-14]|jgi:prevent-host-death family protein|uniref:type II toxin-antitoxin system Phd/YefM family antitoxin n=1 Tax=Pseudoduganella sp. S-14 TaxID=3404065 RepID=UPI003CE79B7D